MWSGRVKQHLKRRKGPRFKAPGCGITLLALILAAGVFLARTADHPSRPAPTVPPSCASPVKERPVPMPIEPPAASISADTGEDGCPAGCAEPPPGCRIKGNVSQRTSERIYHLPGQRWYERTVIVPGDGEAWFCTEDEARANGWRRAKV